MTRRAHPIGPHTLGLVEDAHVGLLRAALAIREGQNEPDLELPEELPDVADDEGIDAFRREVIEALSRFDADELRPAEQRCRRIRALAEGKGVTSLTTIIEQQLDDEKTHEFEKQPDPLCRSMWTFLNARQTFEDAESFHLARQFRDYGRLYDAFEVELEKAAVLDAASVDEVALAVKITSVLALKRGRTFAVADLQWPAAGSVDGTLS